MSTPSAAPTQDHKNRVTRPTVPLPAGTGPDLGLLDHSHVVARTRRRQVRRLIALASACIAIPLVLAAVGHAIVASDQVRSDGLQTRIAQALQTQQDYQLQKAELVAPTRILSIAETHLHMVTPASVTYLAPVNPGESVAQAHEPGRATSAAAGVPTRDARQSRQRGAPTGLGSAP
jgi:hypothetical protein